MGRRLQEYRHDALTVTFEPGRCIHAAACIRALPEVFDSKARPWVRPEAASQEAVIAAVHRCPTGALRAFVDGERVDVDEAPVRIAGSRHGPLVIQGDVILETEDGERLLQDVRIALCRCGQSARQPFCDGTHRERRFRDPDPVP